MNKKECKQALDIYKKFIVRMERVSDFLKVAEVGICRATCNSLVWCSVQGKSHNYSLVHLILS